MRKIGKGKIYKIVNKLNGKVYIGQTTNYSKRKKDHFKMLKYGRHHNNHLQRSYDKYGKEAFYIKVIDIVPLETLQLWEMYYIVEVFNSYKKGYNNTLGAESVKGKYNPRYSLKMKGELLEKIREANSKENSSKVTKTKHEYLEVYKKIMSNKKPFSHYVDEVDFSEGVLKKLANNTHWSIRDAPEWCKLEYNDFTRDTNGGLAKIDKSTALNIYYRYHTLGEKQSIIAEDYNIHRRTVSRIVSHNHWTTENMPEFCRFENREDFCLIPKSPRKLTKHEYLKIYKYWKDSRCSKKYLSDKFNVDEEVIIAMTKHEHWSTVNMPSFCREDDIPSELKHSRKLYSKKECIKAYKIYENNDYSKKKVANITGINYQAVIKVTNHRHWTTRDLTREEIMNME